MPTRKKTIPLTTKEPTVQQATPEELQQEIEALKKQVADKFDITPNQIPDAPVNPLMDKIRMPGQTYQIPSQGVFYTNGELAPEVEHGELHVYPMTTIDEIIIRTPDKLFSGDAIKDVFKRCIPSVLKPTELFAKDVDFLMVCLRQVSYGENFEVTHTHTCPDAKPHDYTIKMNQFIKSTKQLDPTSIKSKFSVTLDNGQYVKLHPIQYKDVLSLMQVFEEEITPELQQDRMVATLTGIVSDVDGVSNKDFIREWLIKIPILLARQLSLAIDATTDWGPDFTVKAKCQDCGKQTELNVPMNPVSFFT